MQTKIVKVSKDHLEDFEDVLLEASEIIKRGGLVVFPTETVYGLGANALDPEASKKIYEAKGRPSDNPLIIHVSHPSEFEKWCEVENPDALTKLIESFVPGPITIIQKKKNIIPDTVTAGMDTVAVRCPSNPIARRLIELSGVPISAPSANTSGRPSPTKASHVIEDLSGRVDMIIDGGDADVGLESTIVMIRKDKIKFLRPGAVTLEALENMFGTVEVDPAVFEKLGEGEKPLAPGMKYRHYAPRAEVVALKGDDDKVIAFMKESLEGGKNGVICFSEDKTFLPDSERVRELGSKYDKSEMAHTLFDTLRYFDSLDVEKVYTRLPDMEDIGLAIFNRLIKASAYQVKEL